MIKLFFILLIPFLELFARPAESLVKKADYFEWMDQELRLDEIRFLQDNIEYYYKRNDRQVSNMNFDYDYVIFNKDGTGFYHQTDGQQYDLIWVSERKDRVTYTIRKFRDNSDLVVNWEDLRFEDNTIKYTEYYTHANGVHSLATAKRIVGERARDFANR